MSMVWMRGAKQQNNKTTKQQNNKTTKQQNNKTTKQQNNKTSSCMSIIKFKIFWDRLYSSLFIELNAIKIKCIH
jgi:hypothetical protein